MHRPVALTPDPTQPQATRVTEASRVVWADSRVALEVREVPCSREECREVEWVLVDLRSVYSFGLHCLLDTQPFEQAVVS